jgi:hypothetical protein
MAHSFRLLRFNKKGKSFKILAFLEKDYRAIPISLFGNPISLYEKPIYGVGFSSDAPLSPGLRHPNGQ